MKRLAIAATLTALGLVSAGRAFAQQSSASASNVPVTAEIVASIGITDRGDLIFGQIVPGGSDGVVTLTPLHARSATGGATLANGTGVTAAIFDVTGEGTDTFAITLPSSEITLTSGSNHMHVDTFATPRATLALIDGKESFAVGASLNVGANQASGHGACQRF